MCADIRTLEDAGLRVGFFGLQNEPGANESYPSCVYTPANYAQTFRAVASAVRAQRPAVKIFGDTDVIDVRFIAAAMNDPANAKLVDFLVMHSVGSDSKTVAGDLAKVRSRINQPLPLCQNEYEYLKGPASPERCVNTVQNIMNWYQIAASPTWYWIHCLKPHTRILAADERVGRFQTTDRCTARPLRLEQFQLVQRGRISQVHAVGQHSREGGRALAQ